MMADADSAHRPLDAATLERMRAVRVAAERKWGDPDVSVSEIHGVWRIRSLNEEVARVLRSRAVNPKWLAGIRRHGYKGAFDLWEQFRKFAWVDAVCAQLEPLPASLTTHLNLRRIEFAPVWHDVGMR